MDITCPKCRFTRSVPDDKIPEQAVRATCPKCQHKFQFRELDEEFLLEGDEEQAAPPLPEVRPQPAPRTPPAAPQRSARPARSAPADAADASGEPASLLRGTPLRRAPEEPGRRPLIPWDDEPEELGEEELDDASSLLRPPPRSRGHEPQKEPADPLSRLMRSTIPPGMAPDEDEEDAIPSSLLAGRRPAARPEPADPRRAAPLLRTDTEHDDPVRAEYVKPVFQPLLQEPAETARESEADDIWRKLERLDDAEGGQRPTAGQWTPAAEEEAEEAVDAPWERLDRYGFFGGLWRTTTRAMFHPGLFFEALPADKGMGRPLAYYVILSLLGHLLMLPWALTTAEIALSWIASPTAMEWLRSLLSPRNQVIHTAVMPIVGTLLLFFYASILHVSLFVFQGGRRGFEATFRVMAYSAAPMTLYLIPFLGPVIAQIWSLFVLIIGLRRIHRTSYLQILLALLLPVAALVILVFAVVYALSGGTA